MILMKQLFTIGHSNHDVPLFMSLLKDHEITAVVDVRQFPYSRHVPRYNRENIKKTLEENSIHYIFMGDCLGARPADAAFYTSGRVDFQKLARAPFFMTGLERLKIGINNYHICLMCAERDPLMCHRAILVCRNMIHSQLEILHIHADGTLENHHTLESRMLKELKMSQPELFRSREEIIEDAYNRQAEKMAAKINSETNSAD